MRRACRPQFVRGVVLAILGNCGIVCPDGLQVGCGRRPMLPVWSGGNVEGRRVQKSRRDVGQILSDVEKGCGGWSELASGKIWRASVSMGLRSSTLGPTLVDMGQQCASVVHVGSDMFQSGPGLADACQSWHIRPRCDLFRAESPVSISVQRCSGTSCIYA